MEYTPTPWRVEAGTTLIWGDCNPDDNSTRGMGYPIAECRITPSGNWSTGPYADEGAANATHIVKCVNLHDELIEVLSKFMDFKDDDYVPNILFARAEAILNLDSSH